jgi:N-methylhydantoinase B
MIVTNDPYGGGGTHLSDVTLAVPIFVDGRLVAFAASKAHWTEVGGKDPGSRTSDATEVYQEGLQFPCVKIYEGGRPVQSVIDMIEANVRLPEMTLGDFHAQAASIRLGARRFEELCAKYGLSTVEYVIGALLDHAETLTRQQLRRLPKGTFEAEEFIDDDGIGNGPFRVHVKVTISDDEFLCDFSGTDPQAKGPINTSYTGLHSSVRIIFKALTGPGIPVNEGCFRPIRIVCPPGTLVTATRPAPTSIYWEARSYASDVVCKALAAAIPERLTASHHLSVCGLIMAGRHHDTGEFFLFIEPQVGGWGGGAGKDGESGLFGVGAGETYNIPIEVAEARYGIRVERYGFDITAAGAGRHRGGRGVVRELRILGENTTVTATYTRHVQPPWGVDGGMPGSVNRVEIVRADGSVEHYGKTVRMPVAKGELLRLFSATGGGWGPPVERPLDAVIADVRDGYVSAEQARDEYGVDLDPQTLEVIGVAPERRGRKAASAA